MKIKDIIPLIDEYDKVLIWISSINGGGRWTMPRKDLIEHDGESKIVKIEIDSVLEKRRGKSDSITLYI